MLLKRILPTLLLAACGALAVPAGTAHAAPNCLETFTAALAATPDPTPTVVVFPAPAIDTAPTVTSATYVLSAAGVAVTCVVTCWANVPSDLVAAPGTPVPIVTLFPAPAVDTAPTVEYLLYDAGVVGTAIYCTGYRDIA